MGNKMKEWDRVEMYFKNTFKVDSAWNLLD